MNEAASTSEAPLERRGSLVWWLVLAVGGLLIGIAVVWIGLNGAFFRGPAVDLERTGPLPVLEGDYRSTADTDQLRVAVATMFSPSHTYASYIQIINAIGHDVGRESTLVIRPSYRDLRGLVNSSSVDVALVCTGPYVLMRETGSVEMLVEPELRPGLSYRTEVIVPITSNAKGLEDLRGCSVAYSDPESHTGCFVLRDELYRQGDNPDKFFAKTRFTGSHDRTIEAVAAGFADAGAVHSLILAAMMEEQPELRSKVRVIWQSESYGPPPVVVPVHLDPALKERLREAFLHLHETPETKAELAKIGIDHFIEPRPADYAGVIELYRDSPVHPPVDTTPTP